NPDWAPHQVNDLADEAGVDLNIKKLRHYTASQLLAARFDLQNTAARLEHGGGGGPALKHYADPASAEDRRQAAYLAELTGAASPKTQAKLPTRVLDTPASPGNRLENRLASAWK